MSTSERRATVVGGAVFLGGALASIAFGDRLWRLAGAGGPVAGHVFGALCGFGVIACWAAARARARRHWPRCALATGTGLVATLAVVCLIPGRNGRLLGSLGLGPDGRMWAEQHPTARLAVLAGLAAGLLAAWLAMPRTATGRRRREATGRGARGGSDGRGDARRA
ncbi:hypothetical protein [Streptomyces sp. G45]|uniref:hypothetical protein n=1 Tax=Streptomyces sp. G45 TaxID=3406627 RepID=UPI003C14C9E6